MRTPPKKKPEPKKQTNIPPPTNTKNFFIHFFIVDLGNGRSCTSSHLILLYLLVDLGHKKAKKTLPILFLFVTWLQSMIICLTSVHSGVWLKGSEKRPSCSKEMLTSPLCLFSGSKASLCWYQWAFIQPLCAALAFPRAEAPDVVPMGRKASLRCYHDTHKTSEPPLLTALFVTRWKEEVGRGTLFPISSFSSMVLFKAQINSIGSNAWKSKVCVFLSLGWMADPRELGEKW